MKLPQIVYNYNCGICNSKIKNGKHLRECLECGRYLCWKHNHNKICPKCSQNMDSIMIEEINNRIKKDNQGYLVKMLIYSISMLLIFIFDSISLIDFDGFLPILSMVSLLFVIPFLLYIRYDLTQNRHQKLIAPIFNAHEDIPVKLFFKITPSSIFPYDLKVEFQSELDDKIKKKFLQLINWYGLEHTLGLIASNLKMRGIDSIDTIEEFLTRFVEKYSILEE